MSKRRKNKKRTTTTKLRKYNPRDLEKRTLSIFQRQPRERFNPKQLAKKLKASNPMSEIQAVLDKLVAREQIKDSGKFKYKLNPATIEKVDDMELIGTVDRTRTGSAYIICDDSPHDIHVKAAYMKNAQNGDKVKIKAWRPRGRHKMEGKVIEIIQRSVESFIGTIWFFPRHAICYPDGNDFLEIQVPLDQINGAEDRDKVIVNVTDWKRNRHGRVQGAVNEVLGSHGSSDIAMKGILINSGFPLSFPADVMDQAEALDETISPADIEARRDMREITTFTIDPDTARDFDDALSIRYLDNGNKEIGIHIADVAHYVLPDTPLDKEAAKRSTSVYLVDRVLPMLPEKLSNGLCSLRPHEDKLTFSAVFTFDQDDKIVDRWFGRAIIHSDRRFTYGEAQENIETQEGDFFQELVVLNKLAKKMRKKRFKTGAINFETDEVKFKLDEEGTPIAVYIKERKDAHLLVEEYMLLANREVATYIFEKGKKENSEIPFVYRIHDEPDMDKVADLAKFAAQMGFEMNIDTPKAVVNAYNKLAEAAIDDPGLKMLQPLAIRTMSKAEYTTSNIGHYGLGFKYYSHFTSPIRRYSDVLAHRVLFENLNGKSFRPNPNKLEEQCKHISVMERKAMGAERESIKYKQVEFMEKHVGETFDGVVAGFSDGGIFVQIEENFCEGRISFNTMAEPFMIAESRLYATGTRTGKVIKMGSSIQVKITATNLERRQIEMEYIPNEE